MRQPTDLPTLLPTPLAQAARGSLTAGLTRAALAAAVVAATGCATGNAPSPATATLTPPAQRFTDEAIQADQRTYETMQGRLKAINDGGRPVRDYGLSKAQCWLDVSFHEYTRNDRSAFPQAALAEAEKLAKVMEASRTASVGWDTPLVNNAERLRPDLWARAQALRGHTGWRCAQQKAACAEVELVHAGNEQRQLQWRHAKPYVQIAEDLLGEADALAQACEPPPPPAPQPSVITQPPPPPVRSLPPRPASLERKATVVFNFDRSGRADIRPEGLAQLKSLAQQLQREGLVAQRISITGHADRLNGTGNAAYNQRLSEKRAATVRAVLAELGVVAPAVLSAAKGDEQQVQACSERFASTAELQECLLPNRRVDVVVFATQAAPR